jgi:hypothetical protein
MAVEQGSEMCRSAVRSCLAGGAFLLAVVVVAVVGLAHASPPDPTWIGGWYDNADYDDVVLTLLAIDGLAVEPAARPASAAVVQAVPTPPRPPTPSPAAETGHSRSPPPTAPARIVAANSCSSRAHGEEIVQ